jgi:two-component system nitrate/nitrite sensor histidine kinase NarX
VASDEGLAGWLVQTASEFQDNTGLIVHLEGMDEKSDMAPEVQAQLIRIVQEALSNTRKHAEAQQVWVSCLTNNNELILEIRDDGHGFSPEDIPMPSRHGMRSMRERADLIGEAEL